MEGEEALSAPTIGGGKRAGLHLEYVESFVALSGLTSDSHCAMVAVLKELRCEGLPVHGMSTNVKDTKAKGWAYAGGPRYMLPICRWLIRLAIKALTSRKRVKGWEVEAVVSRFPFLCLGRRPALSALPSVYSYIEKHYVDAAAELWTSMKRDIRWVSSLLPLLDAGLSLPWESEVA